jgi:hypothetical protein
MRGRPRAIPVIKIARPARDALPGERCDGGRHPSGRTGTSSGEFRPGQALAASAR